MWNTGCDMLRATKFFMSTSTARSSGKFGAAPRIVQMTPLLHALMHAIPDNNSSSLPKPHEAALHELLFHEILAARDVPLSIAMPKDKRISDLAHSAMDDPGSIVSVDEWLAGASASRKTIERLFIAETGMPPSRWLRHARILQAISQLSAGKKISSVAFDLGYESPSAFTYMFRSAIGFEPTPLPAVRKQRRLKIPANRRFRATAEHLECLGSCRYLSW